MPKSATKWTFWRKCKRPVGEENEENEENKKGKRKRAAEIEIEEVSTKDDNEVSVAETKRKTMEHTVTRCDARLPKATPITDDYEISNHVLGLGINGKVVQCYDKNTREKYALKFLETDFTNLPLALRLWGKNKQTCQMYSYFTSSSRDFLEFPGNACTCLDNEGQLTSLFPRNDAMTFAVITKEMMQRILFYFYLLEIKIILHHGYLYSQ